MCMEVFNEEEMKEWEEYCKKAEKEIGILQETDAIL